MIESIWPIEDGRADQYCGPDGNTCIIWKEHLYPYTAGDGCQYDKGEGYSEFEPPQQWDNVPDKTAGGYPYAKTPPHNTAHFLQDEDGDWVDMLVVVP